MSYKDYLYMYMYYNYTSTYTRSLPRGYLLRQVLYSTYTGLPVLYFCS
jgi:hypothetical protein